MTEPNSIDAIEARANVATAGPWFWGGNLQNSYVALRTVYSGMLTVMDFVRLGWRGAQPRFRDTNLLMHRVTDLGTDRVRASDLPLFQVCPECESIDDPRVYRGDIVGIRHPDAEFIAHARSDIDWLLARVRELEAAMAERGEMTEVTP